jgi:hypothetical protein
MYTVYVNSTRYNEIIVRLGLYAMSVFDTQLRVGVGAELNRTSSLRARYILLRYYISYYYSNSIGVHIAH